MFRLIRVIFILVLPLSLVLYVAKPLRSYASPPSTTAAPASPSAYPSGVTIVVNSGGDGNVRDSVITLREAILIARGDLWQCLTDAEMAQIFDGTWNTSTNCNDLTGGGGAGFANLIVFGGGVATVSPTSALPVIPCGDIIQSDLLDSNRSVTIDGTSAGAGVDGLTLSCPGAESDIQVRYLTIRNFGGNGIYATGVQTATLKGLDIHGTGLSGIVLKYDGSHNPRGNQIGDTAGGNDRNYIYTTGEDGIRIEGNPAYDTSNLNNRIQNNWIGLDVTGTEHISAARNGVYLLSAWANTVGGDNTSQRNVISGNHNDGVKVDGSSAIANRIVNNYIGTNATGAVAFGNSVSGVSVVGGAGFTLIGSSSGGGNTILGGKYGVYLGGGHDNTVYGNYIGTNSASVTFSGASLAGVAIYGGAAGNTIGSTLNGWRNIISANGVGIDIKDGGSDANTVEGNFIGTDVSGNHALPNGVGIEIHNGAQQNVVGTLNKTLSNLISGNVDSGVIISDTNTYTNAVYANYIGTNITGTLALPNGNNGVLIENGPHNNTIGASNSANVISGNGNDGVQVTGSGTNFNMVYANTIGLNTNALAKLGNGQSGVSVLNGAAANRIGGAGKGNIIAGNGNAGVFISNPGTLSTFVYGNYIGTNSASTSGLGNVNAGVAIYNGAAFNFIGDPGAVFEGAGNEISGNGGPGVDIANGGTRFNAVYSNLIGTNAAGSAALPNAIGIRLFGSTTNNSLGGAPGRGNIISGNAGPGVGLYDSGTATNTVSSNFIGINVLGTAAISNTMQGIVIQQAAASNVITGNVVSGNGADGILVQHSGTDFNVVSNNKLGTNAVGSGAIPNRYSGVDIANGPYSTTVGGATLGDRNLISGNGTNGVYVQGSNTASTTIRLNYIGLNAAGMAAVPNGAAGVEILDARDTLLGSGYDGGGRYQYISGNTREGIDIAGASGTQVAFSTRVGLASDDVSPLGNGLSGIMLNNAVNTILFNIIAYNGGAGVAVIGSSANNNLVHPLHDWSNGGLAIDLGDDGFTPNGSHVGPGPNGWLGYPVIITATGNIITGTTCANCVVAGYLAFGVPNAPGGGGQFVGATATADGSGVFALTLINGLTPSNTTLLTCQMPPLCAGYGNTSEFSPLYLPKKVYLPVVLR